MVNQVVQWGTGDTIQGQFKPQNNDAISANIEEVPGGILVSWNDGTSDTLTGTTWQIEPIPSTSAMYFWQFQIRILLDGVVFRDWSNDATYSATPPTFEVLTCSNGGILQHVLSCRFFSGKYAGGTSVYCGKTYYVPNALLSNASYFNQFLIQVTANQSFGYSIRNLTSSLVSGTPGSGGYKVTTNTGQTAQRQTDTPPNISLISGGCRVRIDFSGQDPVFIDTETCPLWARIINLDECPPGTCECIHDGHKCCFDAKTGELKKVIPL
jgi:hypothetical protein